ncbi:MAG: penicillin acylase family protein [Vicinamibacterales bacterium]|nr:penicillin acylase family protein [Vicinamibacterales bacterium]
MIRRRVLILTAGLLLLAGAGWWWARGSLPRVEGTWALAGVSAPVEVLADAHLVSHVYARDPGDAWWAVGVLHARDRAWQMELYRRAASGRLAEILGEEALDVDKRLLTLGLARAADAEWTRLSPDVQHALTRYAEGVNAVFATHTGRARPLEFQMLGVTPAAWTPVDSLAIGRLMGWRLAENHRAELLRHALARRIGRADAQRLLGSYPAGDPAILDGAGRAAPSSAAAAVERPPASSAAERSRPVRWPAGLEWLGSSSPRGSSNSWVIAGTKTASGRPLLANDPHLQIELPSVWYEQHVVAAGLDVRGMAIPGVPFVVIGHNSRIAWGLTNSGADVQDFVVERFDVAARRYLDRGRQVPVDVEAREIQVRGRRPEPFEIWRTARGTVFADEGLEWDAPPAWLSPSADVPTEGGERRALVLAWHGLDEGDLAEAFAQINTASSWVAFEAAVSRLTALSQNVVYADVDGHIGYAMSGSVPVRASGDGTMPVEGWSGGALWTGAVSGSRLPRALDPPAGMIATSNNEIDRRWPGLITRDWVAPYRARRLAAALSVESRLDVAAVMALQNDVTSEAAAEVLAGIDEALALARSQGADAGVVTTLERLRDWDRRVDGRPVVTIYQAFEEALWRRTFLDEMDEPLFRRFVEVAGAERPAGLYAILDEPRSRWFDDIGTVERRETRDDIFLLAAADAIETLGARFGSEDRWAWSRVHAARFPHILGEAAMPLGWLFNRGPVPVSGDTSTVMRTSVHRLRPFGVWEYPSFRQVLDVGAWDEARLVLPAGQSGHPLSNHYFDQNVLWREGQYRTAPFSRGAVEAAATARLLLVPR